MSSRFDELTLRSDYSVDILKGSGCYSFINLYSLGVVNFENKDVTYFSDGFLLTMILRGILRRKIKRVSFDFTSIAGPVLDYAVENNKLIYFYGSDENSSNIFKEKIQKKYPNLSIICKNGYAGFDDAYNEIIKYKPHIVVVGLGSPKQDNFLQILHNKKFTGVAFTCGGFITQEALQDGNYYPAFFDKTNTRFVYRILKEKHTLKRYAIDYPRNLFNLLRHLCNGTIKFKFDAM